MKKIDIYYLKSMKLNQIKLFTTLNKEIFNTLKNSSQMIILLNKNIILMERKK